jgi:uncharacterized membrane protein
VILIKRKFSILLIIIGIIGFILIIDGVVSIQLQAEESMLFQSGRIFRIFIGFTLIIISLIIQMKHRKEGDYYSKKKS